MIFDILTLFPELITQATNHSILKRAIESDIVEINAINPRDFANNKHRKVDDTPYGGGAGMVLSCQPFLDCLASINTKDNYEKIILTPQGEPFSQQMAKELSQKEQLIILCGHYEGFDERIRILSGAREVSIGDFVLTGGEYPALCVLDSITRLLPNALGDAESADYDSHSDGLLEYPHYTKPREYGGLKVPEVLLSGNHKEINNWRRLQQFVRTKQKRSDLFDEFKKTLLSKEDKKIIQNNNL